MNHTSSGPIRWVGMCPEGTRALIAIIIRTKGIQQRTAALLQDHLNQLVRAGKLNQFLHQSMSQFGYSRVGYQRDGVPQLALGTINVIFAKPRGNARTCSGVMSMAMGPNSGDRDRTLKKAKVVAIPILGFSEEDKEGTF